MAVRVDHDSVRAYHGRSDADGRSWRGEHLQVEPATALNPIRPVRVSAGGGSDVGKVSDHDDDTTLVRADLQLYLVADGAGGHNAGNVASAMAAASVAEFLEMTAAVAATHPEVDAFGMRRDARRLATAIQYANRNILKSAAESEDRKGMGTTVVAVLMSAASGVLTLAHVGDSRCYRLRDGHLELLTIDHSLFHDILELRPDIDDAALARLPPNVLTRALGMEDGIRVSVQTLEVSPGDRFVLCSDGLTDAIHPEAIASILALRMEPDELVQAFIKAANDAGGPDNISAVVILCDADALSTARTPIQRLPLPRPRRRKRPAPTVVVDPTLYGDADGESEDGDPGDDDQPDLEIDVDAHEPEIDAPDLDWEADAAAEAGDASSDDVSEVAELLLAVDTRLGAAIDRVSGRGATEGSEAVRCVKCTGAIQATANFCGLCGARQDEPE